MKLVLDKVSMNYPGNPVFTDISAEIGKGEKLIVTGPNGSGKTTLLKIMIQLIRPSSGKTYLDDHKNQISGFDLMKKTGYIAPDLFLYDELTALENLNFIASVSGANFVKCEELFLQFGLQGRENDQVGAYSSGMKQKLKYILALLRQPEILMLDEPSANLDSKSKDIVYRLIEDFQGITVIATNEENETEGADVTIRLDS